MIRIFLFAFLSVTLFACKKGPAATADLTLPQIDSIVQLGITAYNTDPRQAITHFTTAGKAYEKLNNYYKAGGVFLNVAVIHEENLASVDSAEWYAKRSLDDYLRTYDSVQIYNTQRYYGFLHAANGHEEEGVKLINEAMAAYTRRNVPEGMAMSHFNLGRLAFAKGDWKTAAPEFAQAKQFYQSQGNGLRVGMIILQELEIAYMNAEVPAMKALQASVDSILKVNPLPDGFTIKYNALKQKIASTNF